jgi:hypothetical protein
VVASAVSTASAAPPERASSNRLWNTCNPRVSATPEKANPSMVREMTRKAKLLRSLAETIR